MNHAATPDDTTLLDREVWVDHIRIRSAASQEIELGQDGIVIAAIETHLGAPLVLMADMQSKNDGCSLTNGIETVLTYVKNQFLYPRGYHIEDAVFIELDSEGAFDRVIVTPAANKDGYSAGWRALHNVAGTRTLDAFYLQFGGYGVALFKQVIRSIPGKQPKLKV